LRLASDKFGKLSCDLVEREHEVGNAGSDRTARHGGVFGLLRILDDDDTARFLHRLDADRAVRPRARQHHGESVAMLLGKRAEEGVDRRADAARLIEFGCDHLVIGDLQAPVRRNYIDRIPRERS
jgi:hypothetical protein